MNKALRFRLYPNREQEGLMKKTFGCCRFIYNRMLADQKEAYEKDKSRPKLTPAMYKGEFLWVGTSPKLVL
ncbi:MAG: helix-turn-helix domain-containing protein [Hungatella sp.]|uniref:helix-turn-helix domain-containing protein n=1 Tax=Hungatella sp. TaxID=2613924 RepID=UPI00399C1AF7